MTWGAKWDAQARDRQVLGERERLSFVDEGRLDERHHAALEQLRVLYGHPQDVPLAPFFGNLAHSPEFFAGYIELGVTASVRSALPSRLRELAILRTAWLYGAPYIWSEHVHTARGRLLTSEEIERVATGPDAPEWDDLDRAVLRAVADLHDDAMISDPTWDALAAHLDERQLLELPILIGHYVTTAFLQNSLRTRLTEHGEGLSAR